MGGSGGGTGPQGTLNEKDIRLWDAGGEKYEG